MKTYSRVDISFLKDTKLPPKEAIRVEKLKSDLSERTIRRQIRNAIIKGHLINTRLKRLQFRMAYF